MLRDRKHLSQDGLIVVVITIEGDTGMWSQALMLFRGICLCQGIRDLMEDIRKCAELHYKNVKIRKEMIGR